MTATTTGSAPARAPWRPWRVAPASGFEVADPAGEVCLIQVDAARFAVPTPFRFSDDAVESRLVEQLVRQGTDRAVARKKVDDARTFEPATENPTDLASIPRFMRWFEDPYGRHTLAAIIHDELIVDAPNGGPLASDTLADQFFREMLRSVGVPWLKRWLMWAAVALRTRWMADGLRRSSVVLWVVLAVSGITAAAWVAGSWAFGWDTPVDGWLMAVGTVTLPVLASGLWGKQCGAGLIAAVAALWILPAAIFAAVGHLVYLVLEALFGVVRLR